MTYESEIVQETFHLLPTAEQIAWMESENELAKQGYALHIECVEVKHGQLVVSVKARRRMESE